MALSSWSWVFVAALLTSTTEVPAQSHYGSLRGVVRDASAVVLRTPGRANWDVAVHKTIGLARARLVLRADVINLFDDPGFFGPLIFFGPANFGQLRRSGNFPRTLQLSARDSW